GGLACLPGTLASDPLRLWPNQGVIGRPPIPLGWGVRCLWRSGDPVPPWGDRVAQQDSEVVSLLRGERRRGGGDRFSGLAGSRAEDVLGGSLAHLRRLVLARLDEEVVRVAAQSGRDLHAALEGHAAAALLDLLDEAGRQAGSDGEHLLCPPQF